MPRAFFVFLFACAKKMHKYLVSSKKSSTFAPAFEGKMAEWSIASVLKTEVRRRTGGSNPSLSAETN